MRGKVTATRLNVRDQPNSDSQKLGVLAQNAIVDILGKNDDWCEINYAGRPAFISNRFVQTLGTNSLLKAKVSANTLNVRNQPAASGTIIGSVRRGTVLDVLSDHDDWLEIRFNQSPAYVSAKYVAMMDASASTTGSVIAANLNVRDQPNSAGKIVGTLGIGSQVTIRGQSGGWYEIVFNGISAYVSAKYVTTVLSDDGALPIAANAAESPPAPSLDEIESIPLAPDDKLDVYGDSKSQKVASTWNKYGRLLTTLGEQFQIEPACAIAVLCVESSGDGFRQDNDGRMIIRFENHKFWSFWGKDNADEFNQYFKLNLADKPWLGHKWRPSPNEDWQSFHGNQLREWQVLEFARRLDDTAALKSISMGAPQIMGFNYAQLDYPNVQAMFEKFSSDMRYQILGLFKFLSPGMINALRNLDFTTFAGYYNGSGQKQQYGQWIEDHYQAFKNLTGH
jgi:uncharacterized protein YgiM (DUF1202 family)